MRNYKISLDIIDSIIEIDELWFVKDDIGGVIEIELKDNNEPINLNECRVIAIFEKKDKSTTQKEAIIINSDEGIIKLNMLNSIIDIPGKVKTEIKIYKGEEEKVTFSPFSITVKKSISMDDIVESFIELDIVQEVAKNTIAILENIKSITNNTKDIEALYSSLENTDNSLYEFAEDVIKAFRAVQDCITEVEGTIEDNKLEVSKGLKDLGDNLKNTNDTLQEANENIKTLQEGKANIIVSLEEPDITGLPLGTIWIKPINQDE